jgi:1,4-dihydroxy-2-naphthoate octaprenyltransferase
MKRGLAAVLGLALLVGIYLTWVGGWPIIAIGLLSMVSAVAYTGGPYPLGYHGLGDVFVMIFFGLVAVCGTTYVHLGSVPLLSVLCALAVGALITNILVVNNVRDRSTDERAGKRTLAVRWGRRGAEIEYLSLYFLAYAIPSGLVLSGKLGPWVLLPLLSIPLAIKNSRDLLREEGRALNRVLVATAKLVFVFGMLFALGIVLSRG